MAVDFFFEPPTFAIPDLGTLRSEWKNVKDHKIRHAIAVEVQYLVFHRYMLESVRHTAAGTSKAPTRKTKLDLTVRGGAIKAAILLTASVCEATLRYHAERRGYSLPSNRQPFDGCSNT